VRRVAQIWFLIATSQVAGCGAPTAPSDAVLTPTPPTVQAVPVQKRPVYVGAPIHMR
jgi:hypothetical protein